MSSASFLSARNQSIFTNKMMANYLWQIGSVIIAVLGSIHLYYTFFTTNFSSRNEKMIEHMKSSSPILTKEVTVWKAWIGFNASHSSGAIFIGLINFYLAFQYFTILQSDHFFFLFNILTISFYVWLAKQYWFTIPFIGLLITFVCYSMAYFLILIDK
ncbi:LIC_13387 family protein [Spirosoma areae]